MFAKVGQIHQFVLQPTAGPYAIAASFNISILMGGFYILQDILIEMNAPLDIIISALRSVKSRNSSSRMIMSLLVIGCNEFTF